MIILLGIAPKQLALTEVALLEERVSTLLRAHRNGQHLVIIDRLAGHWLLNNVPLLQNDRSTLQKIIQDITQTGNLPNQTPYLIRITGSGEQFFYEKPRFINLPLDFQKFDDILLKPIFLVEDISADGGAYEAIFRNMPGLLQSFVVSFDRMHGGGSGVQKVAKEKILEGRIVYAVVDSDKEAPVSSDRRFRDMKRLQAETRWPLYFFDVTPCREVENIFPLEVIGMIPQLKNSQCYKILLTIDDLEREAGCKFQERLFIHFDMKNGADLTKPEGRLSADERAWIASKLEMAGIDPYNSPVIGFGPNLLSQLFGHGICLDEFRKSIRTASWQKHFAPFIEKMMWAFIAPKPQRT